MRGLSYLPRKARVALAFPLCAAGGAVAWWIGMPAPWLAGAMVIAAGATLAGWPVEVARRPTLALMVLLGTQIGASVTWDTIHGMAAWPVSLAMLPLTVAAVTLIGLVFYQRVFGWDRITAFFAANPGALALNFVLAERYGARLDQVAVIQCLRLVFLIAGLPLLVSLLGVGTDAGPAAAAARGATLLDFGIVVLAGGATGLVAERLRVPGGALLGALAASAVLHLVGLVHGVLPDWVMIPCFVVLGMMAGSRFKGTTLADLLRLAWAGTGGFVVALGVSAAGAVAAALLTGLPVVLTLLAFAPGGLEVMIILAFALKVDPAFVAVHQVARFLVLSLVLPFAASWMAGDRGGGRKG